LKNILTIYNNGSEGGA
jgi:large subunit ribosomal protein L34